MPTPEGAVKNWVRDTLKKKYPDCYIYVTHQGAYGKRGVTDLVTCIKSLFVGIEVKTINGSLTALQELEGKRIEASGGVWAVIYGRNQDQMEELFETIEAVLAIRLD